MIFDLREPEHHPHKSHELIWKAKALDFYIKSIYNLKNKAQEGQKTRLLLYFIPPKLQQLFHCFRCI
jgi:hypothetical protein